MKFEWDPRPIDGGSRLKAVAEDYDGFPLVDSLRLDFSPRYTSPMRISVAGILAFAPYMSGAATLPHPVAPEVVRAAMRFLEPAEVFFGPTAFHPVAIPVGSTDVVLDVDSDESSLLTEQPGGRLSEGYVVRLSSGGRHFGLTVSGESIALTTNALHLAPAGAAEVEKTAAAVAAVMLVAEDFNIRTVSVAVDEPADPRWLVLGELMRTVGLLLDVRARVLTDRAPTAAGQPR